MALGGKVSHFRHVCTLYALVHTVLTPLEELSAMNGLLNNWEVVAGRTARGGPVETLSMVIWAICGYWDHFVKRRPRDRTEDSSSAVKHGCHRRKSTTYRYIHIHGGHHTQTHACSKSFLS